MSFGGLMNQVPSIETDQVEGLEALIKNKAQELIDTYNLPRIEKVHFNKGAFYTNDEIYNLYKEGQILDSSLYKIVINGKNIVPTDSTVNNRTLFRVEHSASVSSIKNKIFTSTIVDISGYTGGELRPGFNCNEEINVYYENYTCNASFNTSLLQWFEFLGRLSIPSELQKQKISSTVYNKKDNKFYYPRDSYFKLVANTSFTYDSFDIFLYHR